MTVGNIIKQVRWSLDEESGGTDYVDTYLDNIIKSKVYDALRWVNLYADASLLNDAESVDTEGSKNIVQTDTATVDSDGCITLKSTYMRLLRVRVSSWYKAVMTTIEEDSDEYLMQSDDTAKADKTRPVVALIRTVPNKLELFPHPTTGETVSITYATMSSSDDTSELDTEDEIYVPSKLVSAYIYYICYLVMIAHDDTTKAANMLATAKMHAGVTSSSTSK